MLKKIRVQNFKPFGDANEVRLAPITLIYGPNSSGKSSLVQSLLLMSQTLNGQQPGSHNDLITRGSMIDLGNFSSILHRHDEKRILNLEYEFGDHGVTSVNSRLARSGIRNPFAGVSLGFNALRLSAEHIVPVLNSVGFKVNDFHGGGFDFLLERPSAVNASQLNLLSGEEEEEEEEDEDEGTETNGLISLPRPDREGVFQLSAHTPIGELANFVQEYGRDFSIRRPQNYIPSTHFVKPEGLVEICQLLETVRLRRDRTRSMSSEFLPASPIFNEANVVDRSRSSLQSFFEILRNYDRTLRKTLGGLSYLGPLRTHPARHYVLDGVPGNSVGSRGEQAVQILFHDLETGNGRSPLLERLNEYCYNFEIPYKFDLRNLGNAVTGDVIVLSLTDTRTNVRVGPADVGFGIGQLLPILIEGILVNERGLSSRIVCVEQPEIHLHPRLQAAMADFFIDTSLIREGRSQQRSSQRQRGGVQWILETHSEALILRLQRRIREKRISCEDVSVLYVDPRGEKGAIIQELRLDEDGEFIDLWPDGFFVESLSEMMGGR